MYLQARSGSRLTNKKRLPFDDHSLNFARTDKQTHKVSELLYKSLKFEAINRLYRISYPTLLR